MQVKSCILAVFLCLFIASLSAFVTYWCLKNEKEPKSDVTTANYGNLWPASECMTGGVMGDGICDVPFAKDICDYDDGDCCKIDEEGCTEIVVIGGPEGKNEHFSVTAF